MIHVSIARQAERVSIELTEKAHLWYSKWQATRRKKCDAGGV